MWFPTLPFNVRPVITWMFPIPQLHPDDLKMAVQVTQVMAARSTVASVRSGCVLVHPSTRNIISTGCNHTIAGSNQMMSAEQDLMQKLSCWGAWRCHLVTTHSPDLQAAQLLHRRGVHHVYYQHNHGNGAGITWLRDQGHTVKRVLWQ